MTRTEKYIDKKLTAWNTKEQRQFYNAYLTGDWDTVDNMTSDLGGGQHVRNLTLADLVDIFAARFDN